MAVPVAAAALSPEIWAAIIGAGTSILGNKMKGDQAKEMAPMDLLAKLNPGSALQNLPSGFQMPDMHEVSPAQRLLGGM